MVAKEEEEKKAGTVSSPVLVCLSIIVDDHGGWSNEQGTLKGIWVSRMWVDGPFNREYMCC